MIPSKIDFPVFEANQVLTNDHLNSTREYLDEQNRLTRAILHGIGVVCGLEVRLSDDGVAVVVSKGYGVTSEGYLALVGNEDFVADRFRTYTVPKEDGYSPFLAVQDEAKPFLELLDKGHDNYDIGTPLTAAILVGKIVVLFVETREENLKNCSPASCDDKGKKVTVTCRKLLIEPTVLVKLREVLQQAVNLAKAQGDFFPDLTARLNLPDLRLPRLDFNLELDVTANELFEAYATILSKNVFTAIGAALDEAYLAFQPLVPALPATVYFSERLLAIHAQYETKAASDGIVFSQYFYDFLDDILQAYNEFRSKALELLSLCNPPEELFPRHLELGEIGAGNFAGQKVNRHYFRPSPALTQQHVKPEEIGQLFNRIRLMVENFEIPTNVEAIGITLSRLGNAPLSDKAIPYYYKVDAPSTLTSAWNYRLTRQGRATENLGYQLVTTFHRDFFPPTSTLLFDQENYNFYRIEGHIGKDWREVLEALLKQSKQFRLPIDIMALNAHPSAVGAEESIVHCMTNDLQVIYAAWQKELECELQHDVKIITGFKIPVRVAPSPVAPLAPDTTATLSPSTTLATTINPAVLSSLAPATNVTAALVEDVVLDTALTAVTPPPSLTTAINPAVLASAFNLTQPKLTPRISEFQLASPFIAKRIDILPAINLTEGSIGKILNDAVINKPTDSPTKPPLTDAIKEALKDNVAVNQLPVVEYNLGITRPVELVSAANEFANVLPDKASDLDLTKVTASYQKYKDIVGIFRDDLVKYEPPAENPGISLDQKNEMLRALQELNHDCLLERLKVIENAIKDRQKEVAESVFSTDLSKSILALTIRQAYPKAGLSCWSIMSCQPKSLKRTRAVFLPVLSVPSWVRWLQLKPNRP